MSPAVIDDPETHAEVSALFAAYERALVTNDVAALDGFFFDAPTTIRYGVGENLRGIDAIRAFRSARSPAGLDRTLEAATVTAYGRDFAVASTLFRRPGAPGKVGRQMQSWVRFPFGWRIVAAHVSLINDPEAP